MKKAAKTRKYILDSASDLIYKNGFQSTSIDCILETTNVTKGAFYYHFKNKEEMGIALIHEVVSPELITTLIEPLSEYNNPLNSIFQSIRTYLLSLSDKQIRYGCAATNLIQELPPLSEHFSLALKTTLEQWVNAIEIKLIEARDKNQLKHDNDLLQVAHFIISSYQGIRTSGKLFQSKQYFQDYLLQLDKYLKAL